MLKILLPLTISLTVISAAMPAFADLILPGRCHMGRCWEQKFLKKTLLEKGRDGNLYAIKLGSLTQRYVKRHAPARKGAKIHRLHG
uniref:hypothetical protein n=1 Tax=Stenomitos frigidus TaxID=1886765 RepID=UPI001C62EECC